MLDISRRQFLKITGGFVAGTATVGSFSLIGNLRANAVTASMVTWNMQGGNDSLDNKWNAYVKPLVNTYAYVCLQEAGALPSSNVSDEQPPQWLKISPPPPNYRWRYVKWNIGTQTRPENVYILWLESDPNGGRVNLAICSKTQPNDLIYIAPGLPNGRPSIGMHIGRDHVYTLHAFSGGGGDAAGLITNINNAAQPWYALGDYNREPTWTTPVGIICPPDKPTQQSGGKLDYMVQFETPAVTGLVQPEGAIWSDHAFVTYGTSNISNNTQTVVKLKCLGDIDSPRFLDGRTGDGTVGLAPSTDGFSGTRWELSVVNDAITFKCLGDVDGPRFLDGRTGDGTVGLAPTADANPGGTLSGTRWGLSTVSADAVTIKCFGDVDNPKFLDGRTGDGTVGLAPTADGFSGTKWEIIPF
ncbi:hypothetical protein KBT16_21090 [Nostoc sp. CCCryo 231-06]|nr:hypothetical protein [Nostoc sp. CCCryo 231-06]